MTSSRPARSGFASTSRGNLLTVDEQKRKLELVADAARKIWAEPAGRAARECR